MQESIRKSSIGRNFFFSFSVTLIAGLVNAVYPLAIGLIFGPETLGNFSVLYYWTTFLSIPIINGIGPAVSRFIAASKKEEFVIYEGIGSKLSLIYIVFISILFPILSFTIFKLTATEFFITIVTLILYAIHYLIRYLMQGQEKFKKLSILEAISFGVFIPFMVLFSILPNILGWMNLSPFYFLFIPIIAFHLTFDLIYILPKIKTMNFHAFFKFPSVTKNILLYALLIGLGSLFGIGTSQIQVIISDLYVSEVEVGILSFWNSAVTPINLLSVALTAILVPRITNIRKQEDNLAVDLVNSFNWALTLVIFPFVGVLFLAFAAYPNFLDILTLNKFQMTIYWPLVILLSFQAINSLLTTPTISYFSSSEKKVRINPIASFIYSLSAIISWILLVPHIGVFGFAAGIAIGGILFNLTSQIFAMVISKKKIGFHIFVIIGISALNTLFIFLIQWWIALWVLIIWSVLSLPPIVFGIYKLVLIIKNKTFSIEVDDKLVEN